MRRRSGRTCGSCTVSSQRNWLRMRRGRSTMRAFPAAVAPWLKVTLCLGPCAVSGAARPDACGVSRAGPDANVPHQAHLSSSANSDSFCSSGSRSGRCSTSVLSKSRSTVSWVTWLAGEKGARCETAPAAAWLPQVGPCARTYRSPATSRSTGARQERSRAASEMYSSKPPGETVCTWCKSEGGRRRIAAAAARPGAPRVSHCLQCSLPTKRSSWGLSPPPSAFSSFSLTLKALPSAARAMVRGGAGEGEGRGGAGRGGSVSGACVVSALTHQRRRGL